MTSGEPVPRDGGGAHWQCITETVTGAAHRRQDRENQDAVDWYRDPDDRFLIVAVADGHGGERYTRSRQGARFAVASAISVARDLLISQQPEVLGTGLQPLEAKRVLCRKIAGEWARLVGEDIAAAGSSGDPDQESLPARRRPSLQPEVVAYGSTLMTAIITGSYALLAQIGDGDIVMVDASGDLTRPVEKDARSFANETCSLSMPEAWEEFRTALVPFEGKHPTLFLLATDGYSNSFRADEDFEQVARDAYHLIYGRDGSGSGIRELESNLKTWLEETTESGSGDDITVGLLYRADLANASGTT